MKCKFCGTRIGILERWRLGDFCSQEHKDEYAADLARLNEQIVQDLRKIPARYKAQDKDAHIPLAEAAAQAAAAAQAQEEPDPPAWEFVDNPILEPVAWEPEKAKPVEAPAKPQKGGQWRVFSKVAELGEGRPPADLKKDAERPSVLVGDRYQPAQGPKGSLVSGAYPSLLPQVGRAKVSARLPEARLEAPDTSVEAARWESRQYAQSMPLKQWVDGDGWRWIPDRAESYVPSFEPVLAQYPVVAPWTNWSVVAAPPAGTRMQSSGMPPGAGRPGPMPPQGMPQQQMPGAMQPMPAPMPGMQQMPAGMPPMPGPMPPMQPSQMGGAPGMMMPGFAMPGPAGMYPVAQPNAWGGGVVWHEVAPPLFSAMVDLAHLMEPVDRPKWLRENKVRMLRARKPLTEGWPEPQGGPHAELNFVSRQESPAQRIKPRAGEMPAVCGDAEVLEHQPVVGPGRPTGSFVFSASFELIDCQGDPSEDLEPLAVATRLRSQARTLWRRSLQMPRLARPARRLGVPRRAAPPMVLPLGTLPAQPPAGAFEALERRAS